MTRFLTLAVGACVAASLYCAAPPPSYAADKPLGCQTLESMLQTERQTIAKAKASYSTNETTTLGLDALQSGLTQMMAYANLQGTGIRCPEYEAALAAFAKEHEAEINAFNALMRQ